MTPLIKNPRAGSAIKSGSNDRVWSGLRICIDNYRRFNRKQNQKMSFATTLRIFTAILGVILWYQAAYSEKDKEGVCGELFAHSSEFQEKMTKWLVELRKQHARSVDAILYPEIKINDYGQAWDHYYPVHVFSTPELNKHKLVFRNGFAYLGQNVIPLSTDSLRQKIHLRPFGNLFAGADWVYIMTCEGDIFLAPKGLDVRHSTLSYALDKIYSEDKATYKCIAAAGIMRVHRGQVTYVDNNSGHYHPKPITVAMVLFQLSRIGIDISKVDYDLMGMKK